MLTGAPAVTFTRRTHVLRSRCSGGIQLMDTQRHTPSFPRRVCIAFKHLGKPRGREGSSAGDKEELVGQNQHIERTDRERGCP